MTTTEQTDNTECPTPKGILMVIGGAEKKEVDNEKDENGHNVPVHNEVLDCFVKLIPAENSVVELITTAGTEDIEGTFKKYRDAFTELGVATINHIHHDAREEINFEELKPRLQSADAIFFAGGDQLKLTSIYGGTQMMVLLKKRYIHDKLVIAGTSAGAMALSTPMIYAGVGRNEMIAGNVKITTGLEFLKDVCIDTHFVNRGRFVRMAQVIATNPSSIGIGIEEDTAIIVRNGTKAEVVGCGVIIIINGHNSRGTNITKFDDETPVTIRGLKVDILSREEKFDIPQLNPPHK
ncbi:cyanophycinase [Mucilaginibacter limnophilus]|uniref:Cyanophycinase n=1 Tax=Mucilaginibacter limnophilus TaxID=1932778 RepID=A0A437MKV6_9SPHI|nr:cyanophycinase [Mucilaginibacter limnophilus]RVT98290.1 cyanophycinase [Mucilaginibacter limnophilus]